MLAVDAAQEINRLRRLYAALLAKAEKGFCEVYDYLCITDTGLPYSIKDARRVAEELAQEFAKERGQEK